MIDLAAIEALEKLEKAATPDPWGFGEKFLDHPMSRWYQSWLGCGLDPYNGGYNAGPHRAHDTELIAALRNAAPELLQLAKEALSLLIERHDAEGK